MKNGKIAGSIGIKDPLEEIKDKWYCLNNVDTTKKYQELFMSMTVYKQKMQFNHNKEENRFAVSFIKPDSMNDFSEFIAFWLLGMAQKKVNILAKYIGDCRFCMIGHLRTDMVELKAIWMHEDYIYREIIEENVIEPVDKFYLTKAILDNSTYIPYEDMKTEYPQFVNV